MSEKSSFSLSGGETGIWSSWSTGWGSPTVKSLQTNTTTLSDKVSSFILSDRKAGRERGVSLNQGPSWKGIIFLIPFRNLVYIWLPGTSANCLQCLSLCLLWVCVRRFQRPEHYTHWCYYYASGSLNLSCQLICPWLVWRWSHPLSDLQASSCELQPHPPTLLYLYKGPDIFQNLVFYMYPSNVKPGGC